MTKRLRLTLFFAAGIAALASLPAGAQTSAPASRLQVPGTAAPGAAPAPAWGAPPAASPATAPAAPAPFTLPAPAKAAAPPQRAAPGASPGKPAAAGPMSARSAADACQIPTAVDACRKQCAQALASSPMCPTPSTFNYCEFDPKSPTCASLCQESGGKYAPACPAAPSAAAGSPPPAGTPPSTGPATVTGNAAPRARGATATHAPALAPRASSTLPTEQAPSRTGGVAARSTARVGCGPELALGSDPYIASVDGKPRGAVFTPGKSYTIAGCGFGSRQGSVALNGSGGGMSNLALIVRKWGEDAITVQVDPQLGGLTDQGTVVVVVTRNDARSLQQGGHAFEAAREVVKLGALPNGLLTRTRERPAPDIASPAPSGATLLASTAYLSPEQFCTNTPSTDTLRLGQLPLKPGFAVDRVDVRDVSVNRPGMAGDTEFGDNDSYQWSRQNPFSFQRSGPDLVVRPGWMQKYTKKQLALFGDSVCWSHYEVDVYVKGPRGFAPI